MLIQPRQSLANLAPVVHGGLDQTELERLGLQGDDLLDFSVSTNPLGPAPAALAAARAAEMGRYPDRHSLALRRALGVELGLPIDRLLVANGSAELIWLLGLAYLQPGDRAFILEPTFGEYRAAAELLGAELAEWRASPANDFQVDVAAAVAALRQAQPRLAFLCNPNNPTGTWLTRPELELLLTALPDGLLVVDEAYLELAGRDSPAAPLLDVPNLVLLRSMTKDFGLPGLRLGYAIGSAPVIRALGAAQPPWSVNAAAQAAGLAALGEAAHVEAGRRAAAESRAYLEPRLIALGYRCLPSTANFWLIEVDDAPTFRRALLAEGIQVRDCSSFGLPNFIRLAARPLPECARLVEALERLAANG
jgi:histidinol-phosphate aminotransferase